MKKMRPPVLEALEKIGMDVCCGVAKPIGSPCIFQYCPVEKEKVRARTATDSKS